MSDNSSIFNQVQFVNKKLQEGNSVTQIEKNLKLGKDTLRKQLNRAGYFFNRKNKQFELKDLIEESNNKGIIKEFEINDISASEFNNKIERLTNEFNIKIEGITKEVKSNNKIIQELLELKDELSKPSNNRGINITEIMSMDKSKRKKATFNMDLGLLDKLNECEEKNISKSDIVNIAIKKYLIELGIIKE